MVLTLTSALTQLSHLQNKKKMVFRSKDIVLIKVLHQEKRLCRLMNNHTAALEITVNMHESVLSRKLVFLICNENM